MLGKVLVLFVVGRIGHGQEVAALLGKYGHALAICYGEGILYLHELAAVYGVGRLLDGLDCGLLCAVPLLQVEGVAYEFQTVTRSLVVGVAPCRPWELAVPQGRCGVEQSARLEGLCCGLVAQTVGIVLCKPFLKVGVCVVETLADEVDHIVVVRTARVLVGCYVRLVVVIHDGAGAEPVEQLEVVVCLQECYVGVKLVVVILGKEIGVLTLELALEKV